MKIHFKNWAIKTKLIALMLVVTILSLMIGYGFIIVQDINTFKTEAITRIQTIGQVVSEYCVADLLFQDKKEAYKSLEKLKGIKTLELAVIYDKNSDVFALFNPTKQRQTIPLLSALNTQLTATNIHVIVPIVHPEMGDSSKNSPSLGWLYIKTSNQLLNTQIKKHLQLMIICMSITIFLATCLVLWFQRLITAPILKLSAIVKEVSQKEAYHLRLTKESNDEIGSLYDGVNNMLDQIQERQTLLRKTAHQLVRSKEVAESANTAKSQFLAKMSHELRTPLNSLLILAKELAKNKTNNLSVDQMEAVDIIHHSGTNLLNLINDLLDIAKIEAGKVDLHIEKISFAGLKDTFSKEFSHIAKEKGLTFSFEIEASDDYMISDISKVSQIIRNLLSNAFKFTSDGGIRVMIQGEQDQVKIHVTDTGIGIPIEKQTDIFKDFLQAEKTTTRNYGGTGLGLSIAKELTNLLEGDIRVESKQETGSTFIITMPKVHSQHIKETPVEKEAVVDYSAPLKIIDELNGKTILIVDDDMRNTFALSKVFKAIGLSVVLAQNGAKAIERLDQNNQTFDFILMDLLMPEMDGFECIEKIKAEEKWQHIPIIALSSLSDDNAKMRCIQLGATAFLTKPMDVDAIIEILLQHERTIS